MMGLRGSGLLTPFGMRAVVRSDGKLVTCYYFNEHTDGERFIGATIRDVDAAGI